MNTVLIGVPHTFVTQGLGNWKSEVKVITARSFVASLWPVAASSLRLPIVSLCLSFPV